MGGICLTPPFYYYIYVYLLDPFILIVPKYAGRVASDTSVQTSRYHTAVRDPPVACCLNITF
jgi:hypothetical protein